MIKTNDILNMLPGENVGRKAVEHQETIINNPIYNPIRDNEELEKKKVLMLKEYQKNIIKSANLRIKINKGVQEGQDIKLLLIDAIECISIMTGEKLFYDNNINILKQIVARTTI